MGTVPGLNKSTSIDATQLCPMRHEKPSNSGDTSRGYVYVVVSFVSGGTNVTNGNVEIFSKIFLVSFFRFDSYFYFGLSRKISRLLVEPVAGKK
jgi:hypothetical protein